MKLMSSDEFALRSTPAKAAKQTIYIKKRMFVSVIFRSKARLFASKRDTAEQQVPARFELFNMILHHESSFHNYLILVWLRLASTSLSRFLSKYYAS